MPRLGAGISLVCFQNSLKSLEAGLAAAYFGGSSEAGSYFGCYSQSKGGAIDRHGGIRGRNYICIL